MSGTVADAYSAAAGAWAIGPERIYAGMAEVVVGASLVEMAGRTILDVGAGTGAAGRAAEEAGAAGVVALDAARGMVAHDAASRPPAVVGDALALPFAGASFGGAIAAFSLNHVRSPEAGLREMARVVECGGPVVASAYAADDGHPVKAAVEGALARTGWTPPPWYRDVREATVPLLATAGACRRALDAAALDGEVRSMRVTFESLSVTALVEWRLGMAQHASFFDALAPDQRRRVVDAALDELGGDVEPLVRSILVISAIRR